jgi:hypothetical protein
MKLLIPILFLIFSSSGVLFGQWSSDPTINTPICIQADSQKTPQIISDGNNGCYIAWADKRSGDWKIYLQKINSLGFPQWTTNGIPVGNIRIQSMQFATTTDNNGGIVIAWTDFRSGRNDIYAQRVNPDGNFLWGSTGLAICTTVSSSLPILNILSDNNILVTWEAEITHFSNTDIIAQKIDLNGSLMWGNGVTIKDNSESQYGVKVSSNQDGGATFAWYDVAGMDGIYTQRLDGNGDKLWNSNGIPIRINDFLFYNSITSSDNNSSIISWVEYRNNVSHVFLQKINSSGVIQWSSLGLPISTNLNDKDLHRVISDGNGGAIIAWEEEISVNYRVLTQKISSLGVRMWGNEGVFVNNIPSGRQHQVRIVPHGNEIVITWIDNRNNYFDLYAQKFNSDGIKLWDTTGIRLCTHSADTNFYEGIESIATSNGDVIITWDFNRVGSLDIYAQKINPDGTLTTINQTGNILPDNYSLSQNYPNPFNPETKIRFSIPKAGFVQLSIYNSLGQVIEKSVYNNLTPGTYEHVFEASNLATGIYYYKLSYDDYSETKKMMLIR